MRFSLLHCFTHRPSNPRVFRSEHSGSRIFGPIQIRRKLDYLISQPRQREDLRFYFRNRTFRQPTTVPDRLARRYQR